MFETLSLRTIVRATAIAILAGGGAAALLALAVSRGQGAPETGPLHGGGWANRSRGWITTRGVHHTEFTADAMVPFNWTTGGARLQIANIDRSRSYRLAFTVDAPRPADVGPAEVTWSVDGQPAGRQLIGEAADEIIVRLPTSGRTRAVVTFDVRPTFQPGPGDERLLGVVVRTVAIAPENGRWAVTQDAAWRVAGAVALVVLAVLLCGVPAVVAWLATAVTPLAFVWLTLQDGAFLGEFPATLFNLALGACAVGAVAALLRATWPAASGLRHAAMAVGVVLAVSAIKLAFFSHPLVTIGDGIFQVHRSAMVQAGSYFFTSITPRPFFEFPYAIALFVAAMPFWDTFTQDVDHVWLLRTLSLVADALVGIALYAAARRTWAHPRAALLVAGLWPFARAPLEALCNSNLPNVFGQGLFGVAIAGLIWSVSGASIAPVVFVASAGVLAAAFLSHFSTFSVGVPLVGVVAMAVSVGAGRGARWRGPAVAVAGVLAVLLAWGVYYRHFGEVYRATVQRVTSERVVEEPGSAIAATPAVKFRRWLAGTSDDYGLPGAPLAVAAVAGLVLLVRERRQDAFTRALYAWLLVWVGFTVLGILSPVQMRVNLAAAPVFVCLGAWAIAALADRGRAGAALAAVAVAAIVWNGASLWFMCLGY